MYKIINNSNNVAICVMRLSDNACIPFDPDNTDYQAYLKFIEDGGQAIPSESVPLPADGATL